MTSRSSQWRRLFGEAFRLIDAVNTEHELLSDWTFGGGTALMLQIDHRESYDVDLFVPDPQLLPYLNAAAADLELGIDGGSYTSDGARHVRLAFEGIGEVDFIFAAPATDEEPIEQAVGGRTVRMETPAEIVAKKVLYRGSSIQPRDLFDIAAACEAGHRDSVTAALTGLPEAVEIAVTRMDRLKPTYVRDTIGQLVVREQFEKLRNDCLEIARAVMNEAKISPRP